ncbi:SLC13 family permease [Caldalkalibacillus mannanilyticus]|uniref:SLC13 family permease n=1 Tax=Caldalkalibacillus mannanilyticus TaxID=1418 RepID=UPI0009DF2E92
MCNWFFSFLFITTICFLIPRFRADLVSVCALLALLITGLLTVPEAFAGFSNSVVIMIAALFVVGEGVFQSGLAQKAGQLLVNRTGNSEFKLTIFMILLVALLSGFMSNTGTVAILLPIVVSLCQQMEIHPGKLLMPLAFASSMGGSLTLIGTPPNLIASQSLIDNGYQGLSFFAFAPIALAILLAGIAYLWFIGRRLLDKPLEKESDGSTRFNGEELLKQYKALSFIHYVLIPEQHQAVGKTLKELQWPSTYNVTVLEVVKQEHNGRFRLPGSSSMQQVTAGPNDILEAGQILILYTDEDSFKRFLGTTALEEVKVELKERLSLEKSKLAEVILTPQSRLINKSIKDIHFRDKYGLTVLAINPQYKDPKRPSQKEKLAYGDALLVHGDWGNINLLANEKNDTVVLKYAKQCPVQNEFPYRPIVAGSILLWMMVMMMFEWIPSVVSIVIAAVLMILTGCVRHTDQAYRSINWQTVVLIACMIPMATALEKTGGVTFMSEGLISGLGQFGPVAVLAGLYLIGSVFSQFISNTATAVLLYPVAILTSQQLEVSPIPMVMAVAFLASMSFSTPIATPPNAMVMAAGKYTFFDFVKVGIPLQFIVAIIVVILLPLLYPF